MASGVVGKIRGSLAVILLSVITFGIYGLYWQYRTFKEMKLFSGQGIGGGLGLFFAILLGIVNIFVMPAEVGNLYAARGQAKPVSALTGFWVLLPIIGGIVWLVRTQGQLNAFWRTSGGVVA